MAKETKLLKAARTAAVYIEKIPKCRNCDCPICKKKDRILTELQEAIEHAEKGQKAP